MTHHTNTTTEAPEEKQTLELLLRRFKLMDDIVENLRKENVKAGIEDNPAVMKQFIPWTDFVQRRIKYNGWIESVTNTKTNNTNKPDRFYDVKYLRRKEAIPEDAAEEYESREYPYRKLDSLYRIKTGDGRQWLMRLEGWYGLDINGEEKRISVNDLDFYVKPRVRYERIPKDPEYPNGLMIRVGSILYNNGGDPLGDRIYLTPYSIEKVQEFVKYAKNEGNDSTLFLLKKEESAHSTQVKYEDFIAEDFDSTLERINKPPVTFDQFYKSITEKVTDADKNTGKEPYK